MSWTDYYRRRDATNAVLAYAATDPGGGLPFAEVPGVAEIFGTPSELLLALHYRWLQRLTGHVEVALAEADRDPDADRLDVVAGAWRTAAVRNPVLRRLLDANDDDPALRPAVHGERRFLALSSGLAEPHEHPDDIAKIGAAYLALA